MSQQSQQSEAAKVLADAYARQAQRDASVRRLDYVKLNALVKKQRAALTRAQKKGKEAVVLACRKAVREWNQEDMAWPDDWSRWQRALDDAFGWPSQPPRLEDLS